MKVCPICRKSFPNELRMCPKDNAPLRSGNDYSVGDTLREKYLILDRIGAGGMATVYRVRHLGFNEVRAVKVVNLRLADDENFLTRFNNEALIMRKLQHPNAVRVDDLDTADDGRPFIVMEYLEGRDLRKVIRSEGPISVARAVNIGVQVTAALAASHAMGITHRDIKPDNIMVMGQGGTELVKVLDFGIAKAREGKLDLGTGATPTQAGIVVGTPEYLSPEQASGRSGDDIDPRADIYSLGVVLYQAVTGQLPLNADTPIAMLLAHVQGKIRRPDELKPELGIPPSFADVLMKALEKDRERRYQSAEEFEDALRLCDTGSQVTRRGAASSAATVYDQPIGSAKTVIASAAQKKFDSGTAVETPPPGYVPRRAYEPEPSFTPPPPATSEPPRTVRRRPEMFEQEPERPAWLWPAVGGGVLLVALAVGGYFWMQQKPAEKPNPPAVTTTEPATPPVTTVSDADLQTAIREKLAAADSLSGLSIGFTVNNAVVTLTGNVLNQDQSKIAASIVSGVAGVSRVDNQISVAAAAPPPPPVVVQKPTTPVRAEVKPKEKPVAPKEKPQEQPAAGGGSGLWSREDIPAMMKKADSAVGNGEYRKAVILYQEVLRMEPGNKAARDGLARAKEAGGIR